MTTVPNPPSKPPNKAAWSTPKLIEYGSVETITATAGCDKKYGSSDGYTFMGSIVVCRS